MFALISRRKRIRASTRGVTRSQKPPRTPAAAAAVAAATSLTCTGTGSGSGGTPTRLILSQRICSDFWTKSAPNPPSRPRLELGRERVEPARERVAPATNRINCDYPRMIRRSQSSLQCLITAARPSTRNSQLDAYPIPHPSRILFVYLFSFCFENFWQLSWRFAGGVRAANPGPAAHTCARFQGKCVRERSQKFFKRNLQFF